MQQIKKSRLLARFSFFLAVMMLFAGLRPSYAKAAVVQVNWYNGSAETEISVEAGSKFYLGDFVRIYSDTVSATASLVKASYRTQDKKVASINGKGYLSAKKAGTTDITVNCQGKTLTCHLTVEKKGTFEQTGGVKELKAAAKTLAKGMPKKLNAAKGFGLNKKKADYLISYGDSCATELSYEGFFYENKRPARNQADYKRSARLAVPEAGRYLTAEALLRQFLLTNNPFSVTSKRTMRITSGAANSKNGKFTAKLAKKVGTEQILAAQLAFPKENNSIASKTKANFIMSVYDETANRFYKAKPVLKKGSRQIDIQLLLYANGIYQQAKIEKGHVYQFGSGLTWAGGVKVTAK